MNHGSHSLPDRGTRWFRFFGIGLVALVVGIAAAVLNTYSWEEILETLSPETAVDQSGPTRDEEPEEEDAGGDAADHPVNEELQPHAPDDEFGVAPTALPELFGASPTPAGDEDAYDTLMESGRGAMGEGRYSEAVRAFGGALRVFPDRQEAQQCLDEAERQLSDANFTRCVQAGDRSWAAGDFEQAASQFQQALKAQPDDVFAKDALAHVVARTRLLTAPVDEQFGQAPEGMLPAGWSGDGAIGVRRSGDRAWLQCAVEGMQKVKSPPILFPEAFELEVWAGLSSGFSNGKLKIELVGAHSTLPFVFSDRSVELPNGHRIRCPGLYRSSCRIRIVRDGASYRLIVGDQVLLNQPVAIEPRYVAFGLTGGPDSEAWVHHVKLTEHRERAIPASPGSFQENFAGTREGTLPEGWSGSEAVAVRRDGNASQLHAAADGSHYVRSPSLSLAGDFTLDVGLQLEEGGEATVILEGAGNTADIVVEVARRFSEIRGSMTGAAEWATRTANEADVSLTVSREGDAVRLAVNGRTIVARRMPSHKCFGNLGFVLQGGNRWSRVARISIAEPMKAAFNDALALNAQVVAVPKQPRVQPVVQPLVQLSGEWEQDEDRRYKFEDDGQTVRVSLVEHSRLYKATGVLQRDGDGQLHGKCTIRYKGDPGKRLFGVGVHITVQDVDTLQVRLDEPKFDGWRKTGMQVKNVVWRRAR